MIKNQQCAGKTSFACLSCLHVSSSNAGCRERHWLELANANGVGLPKADAGIGQSKFRSWQTDDGQHPLTAKSKPDAQCAAPKGGFVVLHSQVDRPGFGF